MLDEGLYGLDYRIATDTPVLIGSGLALLRDGKILGTDRCGSVFIGRCDYDGERATNRVSVRMTVAPEKELVTGFAAGAEGAIIDIVAAIEEAAARVETTVVVAGRPVTVRLTYIGPLP